MFKNTILLSPVATNGITTAPKGSLEYHDWWEQQWKYCLEGYEAGGIRITGIHYFYLNFWKIRGVNEATGRKDYIHPRFLEIDFLFFWEWERSCKNQKDTCVGKRRQAGFSEKEAALCGYNFTFFPSSQTVIACGEEKYGQIVYGKTIKGLNLLRKTEFGHRALYEGEVLIAKHKVLLDDGENIQWIYEGSFSELHLRTCKNSDQALVGLSPDLIVWEECGLFKGRLLTNLNYINPGMKTNNRKTGFSLFIGTGGEASEELEELFFKPVENGIMDYPDVYYDGYTAGSEDVVRRIAYFVPGYSYLEIDADGNNLVEDSLKAIHENRRLALKKKDKNAYIIEITQFPLNPDEMFMRTGENGFNIEKLNNQLIYLRKHNEIRDFWDVGRLEWIKDSKGKITGVEFVPDPNGWIRIFEHPSWTRSENPTERIPGLYKSSTDSYDKNQAPTSSSLGSFSTIKGHLDFKEPFDKTYVARITCRPPTAEEFYEMTAKATYYYYSYNLIEWSNIGIFGWYERNGFSHMLKERPRIVYANVADSRVNNKWGIDPSTKGFWIQAYSDYIENNAERMYDEEQIKRAIAWRDDPKYNCDITISSALAWVHYLEDINVAPKTKADTKLKFFHYKTNKSGQLEYTS
jgi:hypothetical protein